MPRPRPLTPDQAKRSLANRFVRLADRLRQLNTKFGIRSKRVFLVWTKFSGEERGAGRERVLARVELLPTPKVDDLSGITFSPFSAGKLPVGSVRVREVSGRLTLDQLTGRAVPGREDPLGEPFDFFFEMVEDGRGDAEPERMRYRLLALPNRDEGGVEWELLLERSSEDFDRKGRSQVGLDDPL